MIHSLRAALLAFAAMASAGAHGVHAQAARDVAIRVDAGHEIGELRAAWRFFGADGPTYAYMKDGRRLLAELASNGIDHPALNAFRMMSPMPERRVSVESTGALSLDEIVAQGVRGAADVSAIASRGREKVAVLAWHYHDDDVAGSMANVELVIDGLPQNIVSVAVTHFRIDDDLSNAFTAWKRMGSPVAPSNAQYATIRSAGQLTELIPTSPAVVAKGELVLTLPLPRQEESLVILDWSEAR